MVSFQQMGAALRSFLETFRKGHRNREHFEEIRKKGREILRLAEQVKEPHLEKETKKLVEDLEQFFSHPEDQKLGEQIAKSALHLEQETREI